MLIVRSVTTAKTEALKLAYGRYSRQTAYSLLQICEYFDCSNKRGDWKRETWHRDTCLNVRVSEWTNAFKIHVTHTQVIRYESISGTAQICDWIIRLDVSVVLRHRDLRQKSHYHGNVPQPYLTRSAQASQNGACPHGASAKPARDPLLTTPLTSSLLCNYW